MLELLCTWYLFYVLRLSVCTWGQFRPAYVRCCRVTISAGSGVTDFPTQRRQHRLQPMGSLSISLRVVETLCCGFYSRLESLLWCKDFPSQSSKITTPLLGFPYSEAKSLHAPLVGLPPHRNNTAGLPTHTDVKPTIQKKKITLWRDMIISIPKSQQ